MEVNVERVERAKVLFKLLNKIWKEGEISKEWIKEVISAIYKKEDKKKAKNYRELLMDTAYEIYVSILNEKMKKVAEKRMVLRQFGFRTGRGTTDAIFTLNYIVNRELSKNKCKIFAFFADFTD